MRENITKCGFGICIHPKISPTHKMTILVDVENYINFNCYANCAIMTDPGYVHMHYAHHALMCRRGTASWG